PYRALISSAPACDPRLLPSFPTRRSSDLFWLRNKPAAYNVDASSGTVPVWQELANLDQAKSNYGAIVYNKAPGILRQLDYLVGEDRKSTRLNSSHVKTSYAVFCLKKTSQA